MCKYANYVRTLKLTSVNYVVETECKKEDIVKWFYHQLVPIKYDLYFLLKIIKNILKSK